MYGKYAEWTCLNMRERRRIAQFPRRVKIVCNGAARSPSRCRIAHQEIPASRQPAPSPRPAPGPMLIGCRAGTGGRGQFPPGRGVGSQNCQRVPGRQKMA
jgi:hypothetical protein